MTDFETFFRRKFVAVTLGTSHFGWENFLVADKVARIAGENGVLSAFAFQMEFMGTGSADGSTTGLSLIKFQSQLREKCTVNVADLIVSFLSFFEASIEGIQILHDEFATSEEPTTWSSLVTELVTDLVKTEGKVSVGGYEGSDEGSDFFFVCWCQDHVVLVSFKHLKRKM